MGSVTVTGQVLAQVDKDGEAKCSVYYHLG